MIISNVQYAVQKHKHYCEKETKKLYTISLKHKLLYLEHK